MTTIRGGLWAAIGLAPLALLGCLASETPSPDSETHFLTSCEASCPDALSCICGVCTAACNPARDCSAQHPEASCVTLGAFADEGACGGEEADGAPVSVCELECEADGDCDGLSSP